MKTIAIANQKGGTGKTTTTYNLGIALTQQGYRVLMVDFDPQGNLSCYCGIPPEKDLDQIVQKLSVEKVAEGTTDGYKTIQRFIRLNNLVPDLQKKVDDGSLKFNPAVELSYLTPTEQNDFLDYIESQSCSPSLSQAQKLKAASKEGALNHGKLLEIMDSKKPSVPPCDPTLTISVSKIARYFPAGYTQEQMVGIIMQLLERNSRHLMPEKQPSLER